MPTAGLQRVRLHQRLLAELLRGIRAGAFNPQGHLPPEADLAQRFSVSRGIVREAIRGLEERGVVTVKHGSGTTVNPTESWDVLDSDVLEVLLGRDGGGQALFELLECRRIFEVEAAALAAERASADDLALLADVLADMKDASCGPNSSTPFAEDRFHEADVAFHAAIMRAAGNRALSRLTEPIQRVLLAARRPLARPEYRMTRGLPEHERILAAIATRDPDQARLAMREHLSTVERYLREYTDDGLLRRGGTKQQRRR